MKAQGSGDVPVSPTPDDTPKLGSSIDDARVHRGVTPRIADSVADQAGPQQCRPAAPAEGERNAIVGYLAQYELAAMRTLDALREGTVVSVRVADVKAGQIDDFQLQATERVDAHQVKWHLHPGTVGYAEFVRNAKDRICYIRQLADGWERLSQLHHPRRVVVHFVTNDVASSRKTRSIPRPDDNGRSMENNRTTSFAAFLSEAWYPAVYAARAGADPNSSVSSWWLPAMIALANASGLDAETWPRFVADCELEFGVPSLEASIASAPVTEAERMVIRDDANWLAHAFMRLVARPDRRVEFTREQLLDEVGWRHRAEFEHTHEQLPDPASQMPEFLAEYRSALAHLHRTWTAGPISTLRNASEAKLDDLYVPLRLAPLDSRRLEDGEPITPAALVERGKNLVIRGGPGNGKTTWMRWTFRQLLRRDDAFPVLIELRDLARMWSNAPTIKRLEHDLFGRISRELGEEWSEEFHRALTAPSGPRPILMLDGWDELGDLGQRLRDQVDRFADHNPRALVIATSRPYGEGVPRGNMNFDEVQLQPLADSEIDSFVNRLAPTVFGPSWLADDRAVFFNSLASSPSVRALARTPLLLLMLLTLSRGQPLPDKRHVLYQSCLEKMLEVWPRQRDHLGALPSRWEWRPERYEQRLVATTKLAVWMYSRASSLTASRSELEALLPADWNPSEREGFLQWLVNSAGLMVARTDDSLIFSHLGFQEYLVARDLQARAQNEGVESELDVYVRKPGAWEVLRLWAALTDSSAPEQTVEFGRALLEQREGFWLLGSMLADGVVHELWLPWLALLHEHFDGPANTHERRTCADAWNKTRQLSNRADIAAALADAVRGWTWIERERAVFWSKLAGIDGELPRAPLRSRSHWVSTVRAQGPTGSEARVAWGRVWSASSPWWGGSELVGLRLWPTRRAHLGQIIQAAVSLGATRRIVLSTPWHLLVPDCEYSFNEEAMLVPFARDLGWGIEVNLYGQSLSRSIDESIAVVLGLGKDFLRSAYMHHVVLFGQLRGFPVTPGLLWDFIQNEVKVVLANSDSEQRGFDALLANNIASSPKFTGYLFQKHFEDSYGWPTDTSLARDFGHWLISSALASPVGTRTLLAHSSDSTPLMAVLRSASSYSLEPDPDRPYAVPAYPVNKMWSALARHVARCSTLEDQVLLQCHVIEPMSIAGLSKTVRWGLKYWVRGDILFPDGSTMTLDELWSSLGDMFPDSADQLGALPLLDPYPDDVPLDPKLIQTRVDGHLRRKENK